MLTHLKLTSSLFLLLLLFVVTVVWLEEVELLFAPLHHLDLVDLRHRCSDLVLDLLVQLVELFSALVGMESGQDNTLVAKVVRLVRQVHPKCCCY